MRLRIAGQSQQGAQGSNPLYARALVGCIGISIVGMLSWLSYVGVVRVRLSASLIKALQHHDSVKACMLLQEGADPNYPVVADPPPAGIALLFWWAHRKTLPHGKTALMLAAGNEDVETVKELIARGANVRYRDENGDSALLDAAKGTGIESNAPLLSALPAYAVMKRLMDAGADVNVRDTEGWTPLSASLAVAQRTDCEMLLLDHGAQADLKAVNTPIGAYGWRTVASPLGYAVSTGRVDLVKPLLDHGADVNVVDGVGSPVLIDAAIHNHADVVRLLLDYGAPVETHDAGRDAALTDALLNRCWKVAKVLLERGASVPNVGDADAGVFQSILTNADPTTIALLKQAMRRDNNHIKTRPSFPGKGRRLF